MPTRHRAVLDHDPHQVAGNHNVRIPSEKAKVETGAQIAERQIVVPLRHQTFFSLAILNSSLA